MEKLLRNSQQYYNNNPHLKSQNSKTTKAKKKPIKIKYISSPMMVTANNASEFRAIVQELTGQNSNVSELSDDVFDDHDDYQSQHERITGWFPSTTQEEDDQAYDLHHQEVQLVDRRTAVDDHEKFSNPDSGNVSFGAQFDDQAGQFWRSEVVSEQSFGSAFQSPCVFV